jgi:hypothetical protein
MKSIRIGGASGYWGESDMAVPQLLAAGGLDFIVFDYLAEITMSIMARARQKDPAKGYATDFVSEAMAPHLAEIARQGVKIISNAGGVNPQACAEAVRAEIREQELDLKVAVVLGDDLSARAGEFAGETEMFTGEPFPDPDSLASINAYLGAFPIAAALDEGADIVITGRCVDSAVTLGACIHAFAWARDDWDRLAAGSLAGHIIECGPQATGGNHTDWESVADSLADVGYPIVEVGEDGSFDVSKPAGSGGAVTVGTVGEQMLYEIGDPQAYMLPDVVCDFSTVTLRQAGEDRVRVAGATGRPATDRYKVSATHADGFRAGAVWFFYGEAAGAKARSFADTAIARARRKLCNQNAPDFDETLVEVIGDESHYGAEARVDGSREVAVKIAARHRDAGACAMLLKEITGLGLSAPPGLSGFAGARSRPSPMVRLFSMLVAKETVALSLVIDGKTIDLDAETGTPFDEAAIARPTPPACGAAADLVEVPLIELAFARSGDKGNKANIGVLPRKPEYAPWIWAALTEQEVARRFAHFLAGGVERWYLPGTGAINFLLDDVLGGGGIASLRNDPQAKGYSQILLQTPIAVPRALVPAT